MIQSPAVELYQYNGRLAGAFWETLGHVEVFLRDTLAERMATRQKRRESSTSWLDDYAVGLDRRALTDIATAQRRVRSKRKQPGDGQIVSELSFGFWRFLLAKRYQTTIWPDLAAGFPHAESRSRVLIEDPVVRLHEFRNRIAHQQRIWTEPVADRYADCLYLGVTINPDVTNWIAETSPVPLLLNTVSEGFAAGLSGEE